MFFRTRIILLALCALLAACAERVRNTPDLDALRRATAAAPADDEAAFALAVALQHNGQFEEAEGVLSELLRRNPRNSRALCALAWSKIELEKYDEAERALRAALTEAPQDAMSHNNLGVVYLHRGDTEAAAREFMYALRIDPALDLARENLHSIGIKVGVEDGSHYQTE